MISMVHENKLQRHARFNKKSSGTKNPHSQKSFVENLGSWDMGARFIQIAFTKDKEKKTKKKKKKKGNISLNLFREQRTKNQDSQKSLIENLSSWDVGARFN